MTLKEEAVAALATVGVEDLLLMSFLQEVTDKARTERPVHIMDWIAFMIEQV
jgi:hypothetical protein